MTPEERFADIENRVLLLEKEVFSQKPIKTANPTSHPYIRFRAGEPYFVEHVPGNNRIEIQSNAILLLLSAMQEKEVDSLTTTMLSRLLNKNNVDTSLINNATSSLKKKLFILKEKGKEGIALAPKGEGEVERLNIALQKAD